MRFKKLFLVIVILSSLWTILTLWVQYAGKEQYKTYGEKEAPFKVLISYNPDPIYNLDEQVCNSIANGLKKSAYVHIATVDLVDSTIEYDLVIFCANTYNFAPDWKTTNLIKSYKRLENKKVVALTLGSGSTKRAARLLRETIIKQDANLIREDELWVMKPNDENDQESKNIDTANKLGSKLGEELGQFLKLNKLLQD